MQQRPNILFLMADQMQARVFDPDHPCLTPNLDRLAAKGVRFTRAYTPNAICSPARASLMTGLLPHNHGVLEVIHTVDEDQCNLRLDKVHWAQRLVSAGYRTGYFGKWHVERSDRLAQFGWQVDRGNKSAEYQAFAESIRSRRSSGTMQLARCIELPTGYKRGLHYGVTDEPPETRGLGITTAQALEFLDAALVDRTPWCCFVSLKEPHDPFVTGREAFERYDVESLKLAPNTWDDMADKPGVYRKAQRVWADMTERERREAAACYYASITEIDEQFGRLLERVERAGQLDNTIVVVTSDHGELLGAHGLYCKNISAFEEVYNIPLIMAGPGISRGAVSSARVGLHDLCPTLLDLVGLEPIDGIDARSFLRVLDDPGKADPDFQTGYAEYHGGRHRLTQRILWDGPWKMVWNGFDFDELYNLDDDPYEMRNLADDPTHAGKVHDLMAKIWQCVRDTGDDALWNSHYPPLRLAPVGPGVLDPAE